MKKKFFIVIAVMMAFSLMMAACGGGMTTPPADTTPAPAPDTTAPAPDTTAPAGDVVELTLMNHEGPQSATAYMIDAWCAAVKEASGGSLIVTPFHGSLGGPRDTYNMILDGSVDMGFGLPSFYPGVFPGSDCIALPFIGAMNSMQAGHAMQELYETTDYLKPEWSDVHVICLYTNTVAPLITADKKVETINDVKGLNIRTIGGPVTEWAKLAGANPMTIDLGEIYTSFEKGVINAVTAVGWEAVEATKIYELGNYFLDYEMQVNPTFLVMNQAKYDSLSDENKAIIDSLSGHKAIDIQGDMREQARQRVYQTIADRGGDVYKLPDAEQAKFVTLGEQARQSWRDSANAAGIDAAALEAKTIELLAKYAEQYPDVSN